MKTVTIQANEAPAKDFLSIGELSYIKDEKKYWETYSRLEKGVYEDGKSDGVKIGRWEGL
ncbi:MAG: hypothetical protein GY757_35945, partial [bacterium]|nr:hypothetical protein [bacterium]